MARKLPWDRDASRKNTSTAETAKSHTSGHVKPSPRNHASRSPTPTSPLPPPSKRVATPASVAGPSSLRDIRSPSTSPPPEPPRQEFMVSGAANDDRFRMVDDELLHTAQQFTAHLHRAEYDRLKRAAKAKNAAAIRLIERPVVPGGTPTLVARRRREAVARSSRQRSVLGQGDDDDDIEADLPWMGTSLQGLMEVPRREAKAIPASTSGSVASTSGTRAAAGFGSAVVNSPTSHRTTPVFTASSSKNQSRVSAGSSPRVAPRESSVKPRPTWPMASPSSSSIPLSRRQSEPVRGQGSEAATRRDADEAEEEDDDDPFGLNKRRVRREISKEQLRKRHNGGPQREPSPDSIPSFLF